MLPDGESTSAEECQKASDTSRKEKQLHHHGQCFMASGFACQRKIGSINTLLREIGKGHMGEKGRKKEKWNPAERTYATT